MGWLYGLVEEADAEGQRCLVLREIYDLTESRKGRIQGMVSAPVDWKQYRRDREVILSDVRGQLRAGLEFYLEGGELRKRRRAVKDGL